MYCKNFTLDSLQIYFPWDDDLYTYLKKKGLMSLNSKMRALPLIYSDNCLSTQGVDNIRRNYIINPSLFGIHDSHLGWKKTDDNNFIIPTECPQLQVTGNEENIKLKFIPKIEGKNQYHIEYSIMSSFGKMYSNWVNFYLPFNSGKNMITSLIDHYKHTYQEKDEIVVLNKETKQAQREQMHWIYIPVISYSFSIGEFEYATKYLVTSGVKPPMPSLIYDSRNKSHNEVMKPYLKSGIVETKEEEGFWRRDTQFVFKLAQDKTIVGERGKKIKVKGYIDEMDRKENYIIVPTRDFLKALTNIRIWYNLQPQFTEKL